MEQTEQKIKMESDTFALKREYKYALENLEKVKSETAEVISTKERVTKELEQKQTDLTEVLNNISQEKLDWATHRHSELAEIENKQSEVENILKWKADLNKKEEELRQIEASAIEARNEARRLELQNETTVLDFDNREKQIAVLKKEVEEEGKKIERKQVEFKEKVIRILEEVHQLS